MAELNQAASLLMVFSSIPSMSFTSATTSAMCAGVRVFACQISCGIDLAGLCWLLGGLSRTLTVLRTQQRCLPVAGYTSAKADQTPSALSPTASFAGATPQSRILGNAAFPNSSSKALSSLASATLLGEIVNTPTFEMDQVSRAGQMKGVGPLGLCRGHP